MTALQVGQGAASGPGGGPGPGLGSGPLWIKAGPQGVLLLHGLSSGASTVKNTRCWPRSSNFSSRPERCAMTRPAPAPAG